jgi:hypothetical protein
MEIMRSEARNPRNRGISHPEYPPKFKPASRRNDQNSLDPVPQGFRCRENLGLSNLARTVQDLYFEPKYEEIRARTIWSLSNAFTSAFKELTRSHNSRQLFPNRIMEELPTIRSRTGNNPLTPYP